MGDRANIFIVQHAYELGQFNPLSVNGIYLYTHGGGWTYPEALRMALKDGESRWGDEPYLTRMLIDAPGVSGVSTYLCDNDDYPVICVDDEREVVGFAPKDQEKDLNHWTYVRSYEDYVAMEHAKWPGQDAPEEDDGDF